MPLFASFDPLTAEALPVRRLALPDTCRRTTTGGCTAEQTETASRRAHGFGDSDRLDPATATGLALTLALGLAIIGGALIGILAYLIRSSGTLVHADFSVGQWGVDNATSWSTDAIRLITQLGNTYFIVIALVVVAIVEFVRIPNRWVPVFLVTVMVGDVLLVNTIKGILDRVRPTFDPIAERLGPSFPSGHSAAAAAFYAAAALVLARRRPPRVRALLAGGAVTIAVAVACSRVMLGLHWMSDVIAGLAFGWAWFGICAIAFGAASLSSAPRCSRRRRTSSNAAWTLRVRRRRAGSVAGQQAPPPTRNTRQLHEPMRQSLAVFEELELLRGDALPVLVDEPIGSPPPPEEARGARTTVATASPAPDRDRA
jgi:undecaprenyl-diphosphatase